MRLYFFGYLLLIALTAPWIFIAAKDGASVAGLPLWAIYVVAASAVFALFVAISYARLWDQQANTEDED